LQIHSLILKGIDDAHAGYYRSVPVRISGPTVVLPNPRKVPELISTFVAWIQHSHDLHPLELAAEAHYRLVTIHPFVVGNGRTARLLMNMILLMNGYPAAIIHQRERLAYIAALEKAQLGGSKEDYQKIIVRAADRSLDIYLKAVQGESDHTHSNESPLLKMGALAKQTGESHSTLRHWTKEGLLQVAETTESGYQLYALAMVERIAQIHALKEKRYTLQEIKHKLS
jgi:Fic family protein